LLESSVVAATKIGKKSEASQAISSDDDAYNDDSELFTVCSEIASEEDLLSPVHKALTLWESCFPAYGTATKSVVIWERAVDWTVSVDYVEVLVLICKAMEVSVIALCLQFCLWFTSDLVCCCVTVDCCISL